MLTKSEFMGSVKLKAAVEKQRREPPVRVQPVVKRLSWEELDKRFVGKKFRSRRHGVQLTLSVVDVTLGGDLLVIGHRDYNPTQVTQKWWLDWLTYAKPVA